MYVGKQRIREGHAWQEKIGERTFWKWMDGFKKEREGARSRCALGYDIIVQMPLFKGLN